VVAVVVVVIVVVVVVVVIVVVVKVVVVVVVVVTYWSCPRIHHLLGAGSGTQPICYHPSVELLWPGKISATEEEQDG